MRILKGFLYALVCGLETLAYGVMVLTGCLLILTVIVAGGYFWAFMICDESGQLLMKVAGSALPFAGTCFISGLVNRLLCRLQRRLREPDRPAPWVELPAEDIFSTIR
jgi:hypothetical protein